MRVAARRAKLGEESAKRWAVYSLNGQRVAGRMRIENTDERARKGGQPNVNGVNVRPTLQDLLGDGNANDARVKAHKWMAVATVADDVFDKYVEIADEPTRSRLLQLGRVDAARRRNDAAPPGVFDDVDVRVGDFRTVLGDVADVDAIVTDPPYPREFLPLYADLAAFADRVLKPDGLLVVMCGQVWLARCSS